jgi:glycosyltransferase involved in cell wall biosynthesis
MVDNAALVLVVGARIGQSPSFSAAAGSQSGTTVILEAMAMGKPIVCSRTRGLVDGFQDGVTGIDVPAGDPVALREAGCCRC